MEEEEEVFKNCLRGLYGLNVVLLFSESLFNCFWMLDWFFSTISGLMTYQHHETFFCVWNISSESSCSPLLLGTIVILIVHVRVTHGVFCLVGVGTPVFAEPLATSTVTIITLYALRWIFPACEKYLKYA